jgi:hypothetical protein
MSHRRRENKPASFNAHNGIDFLIPISLRQPVNYGLQAARVFQQRGDVIKQNARLGEIRYFADHAFQVVHGEWKREGNSSTR